MNARPNITMETFAASGRVLQVSGAAGLLVGLLAGGGIGAFGFIVGAVYGGAIGISVGYVAGVLGAAIGGRHGCAIAGTTCGAIGGYILGSGVVALNGVGILGAIALGLLGLITGLIIDRWLNRVESSPGMFRSLRNRLIDSHLYDLHLIVRLVLAAIQLVPFMALIVWASKCWVKWTL